MVRYGKYFLGAKKAANEFGQKNPQKPAKAGFRAAPILAHFAALIFYILIVIYMVAPNRVGWFGFFLIVFGLVFTQLLCAAFLYANKLLNQK